MTVVRTLKGSSPAAAQVMARRCLRSGVALHGGRKHTNRLVLPVPSAGRWDRALIIVLRS